MSRSVRLLDLIQSLRRHRRPVSADVLAEELGVSVRTIYRDIASLVGQGAPIDGQAGVGYLLRPGFDLPPLMFTVEEIEAVTLGLRFVIMRADAELGAAAQDAAAKIKAVLPDELRHLAETSGLLAGPDDTTEPAIDMGLIRSAIRRERKLNIRYRDRGDEVSQRTVWPIALGFFNKVQILAAWCETRADFRHFRTDRILLAELTQDRMPRHRAVLMSEWRVKEKVPETLFPS